LPIRKRNHWATSLPGGLNTLLKESKEGFVRVMFRVVKVMNFDLSFFNNNCSAALSAKITSVKESLEFEY
jgi:hypothetical protein